MNPAIRCFVAMLLSAGAVRGEVPAFPGAEGAGMFTTGGRGGEVVHVTNLRAAGPGSLADAVSQPHRIVVFDVSGIIDLTAGQAGQEKGGKITIQHPGITIAGQTAPGEGICLKGGSLDIAAGNVIVRYLRSRRGFIRERDTGDAIELKAPAEGVKSIPSGQSTAAFDKRTQKKLERGKVISAFAHLSHVIIDHCSASWATDENLTATHVDRTTISWSIAAEGCDYTNPKQTPPNHSEGSLWGSSAPDGRSTMHHMLYAHNRLRNPRTTGEADVPAVLNFYNNVIYNWSEYASHTGQERVLLNWLNNYYKPGPDTPAGIAAHMFEFHGDPGALLFASGNFIEGAPAASAQNKLAVFHNQKFKNVSDAEREAMKVDAPFPDAPPHLPSAREALAAVLAEAGATLPARDAVDLRFARSVRDGTGRIIGKETDLPAGERWPAYRSLPMPKDSDGDGIPDYWERQFGLNPSDRTDSAKTSAGGYANIEHYFNNTDPVGGSAPIVFISAPVSRAAAGDPGEWRIARSGDTAKALRVSYVVGGDAVSGMDFEKLAGSVEIPAGQVATTLTLQPLATAHEGRMAVVSLATDGVEYHTGCPSASLVVIQRK